MQQASPQQKPTLLAPGKPAGSAAPDARRGALTQKMAVQLGQASACLYAVACIHALCEAACRPVKAGGLAACVPLAGRALHTLLGTQACYGALLPFSGGPRNPV